MSNNYETGCCFGDIIFMYIPGVIMWGTILYGITKGLIYLFSSYTIISISVTCSIFIIILLYIIYKHRKKISHKITKPNISNKKNLPIHQTEDIKFDNDIRKIGNEIKTETINEKKYIIKDGQFVNPTYPNTNKTNTIKVSSYERKYPTVSKENNSDNNKKIGDAYELYVGSILTKAGFDVVQYGIENGNKDLGRDIIAYKGNLVRIIQCKCWSSDSRIHENVICQLYGTSKEFEKASKEDGYNFIVEPYLYTTTMLTETASDFAFRLNVNFVQQPMNWKFYKE